MARKNVTPRDAVEAAAVIADESGFATITAAGVARRLGIQTPSLYAHVRDRETLLDEVTALAFRELAVRVGAAIAGRAGRDALVGWATAHRDYAQRHPGRWQAMQRPPGSGPAGVSAARELVALNSAVLRGYDLPEPEHVHATRLLGSTINGFLTLEGSGAFAHRAPPAAASWDRVLDALDAVLRAWSADREGSS